jgi:hypothetical protein
MNIHKTATGHIERLATGGHGKPFAWATWSNRPATLTTDDDDGHFEAWGFTGKKSDAVATLAQFFVRDDRVVLLEGNTLRVERAPDDFWIEADGEFVANVAAHPDIVAY